MKIRTKYPTEFGKTLRFGDEELTFDRLGCVEVSDKEGKELLERYIDHLSTDKEIAESEEKEESYKADKVDQKMNKLFDKIKSLETIILEKDATIEAVETNNKEWKEVVDQKTKEASDAIQELEGLKVQKEKEIDELKLQVKLAYETTAGLASICEKMGIDKSKYEKLTKKGDLITLILDESRK